MRIHYDTSMKSTQCMNRENFSLIVSKVKNQLKTQKVTFNVNVKSLLHLSTHLTKLLDLSTWIEELFIPIRGKQIPSRFWKINTKHICIILWELIYGEYMCTYIIVSELIYKAFLSSYTKDHLKKVLLCPEFICWLRGLGNSTDI